jgi:hypothetical protein
VDNKRRKTKPSLPPPVDEETLKRKIAEKMNIQNSLTEDDDSIEVDEDEEDNPDDLEPIIIIRPDTQFRVLKAFQKHGIFFIDLETGSYIDGLIYLPSIGLSFTPPPVETAWQPTLGFLKTNAKVEYDPDTIEVDAVLFFEYQGPECQTGLLGEIQGEKVYLYYLTIWNDYELRQWDDIVSQVISDLTITKNGRSIPLVKFVVTSSFVPNKPTEANRLVLEINKSKGDEGSDPAISSQSIVPQDDGYEDEEDIHKFRPRY